MIRNWKRRTGNVGCLQLNWTLQEGQRSGLSHSFDAVFTNIFQQLETDLENTITDLEMDRLSLYALHLEGRMKCRNWIATDEIDDANTLPANVTPLCFQVCQLAYSVNDLKNEKL